MGRFILKQTVVWLCYDSIVADRKVVGLHKSSIGVDCT